MFDFEKLNVFQVSLKCIDLTVAICKKIPRGHRQLADQLQRSITSVALNIAEGAGEFSSAEKCRFYRISLRSATESASTIQIIHRLDLVDLSAYQALYLELVVVVKMLTRLINSISNRKNLRKGRGKGSET